MRILIAMALAWALTGTACANDVASDASQIEPKRFDYPYEMQVFDLPTSANGINYRIYVRLPLREPAEGEKHSAFFFLDPLTLMTPAAAMTYNYEYFNYLPSAYYIGIGYADESDGAWKTENRTRDYTPTSFVPPEGHFLADHPKDWQGSGGAPAFFDVVEKEIMPFLESRYGQTFDDRVLIGKSMSGLGATYALLERPELFNRYIIVSPAIWWDDFTKPHAERWVMKAVAQADPAAYKPNTRVYFAVGDTEERLKLVTDMTALVDGLKARGIDNLSINMEVLPNEQHEGVFPGAFMKGIVGVYAGEPDRKPSASQLTWGQAE